MFKKLLTETDFFHLSEMIKRSLSHIPPDGFMKYTNTQERENSMFEHVNNSYNDSTFYFCIIGAGHVLKPYHITEAKLEWSKNSSVKAISVGKMLEQNRKSRFKKKIILCEMTCVKQILKCT